MTHIDVPRIGQRSEPMSQGGRLVSTDGKVLPLNAVSIEAEAAGGISRTELRQVFANPYDDPLQLTYTVPLPADGAVAGYEFRLGHRVVRGEIDLRAKARERFDEAILEGKTGALLDQERSSLFTQEIGNVPPREEVSVRIAVDHPLAWLPEGSWEWRFPTVAVPRYLGGEGRTPDAGRVEIDVTETPLPIAPSLALRIADLLPGVIPESPGHTIACDGGTVRLSGEGAALDRDLVIRWRAAGARSGITIRCGRRPGGEKGSGRFGLLTIVPPVSPDRALPRDLILLLDVSGSMTGPPIEKAKLVASALVRSLGEKDMIEVRAFASAPRAWKERPVAATPAAREEAVRWIASLRAGGGTEMVSALRVALQPIREEARRQVVLLTDGDIGFESEALRAIRDGLPAGSRLHAVGVGSAVNRTLLSGAARAGRGVEVLVDLDEDPSAGTARILAATRAPVVTDLSIDGSAVLESAPRRPADLMAGAPVRAALRVRPEGGEVRVRGRGPEGAWESRITVPAIGEEEDWGAPATLFGREAVEDLEMDLAAGEDRGKIEATIERLGMELGIATRLTSWVAVSTETSVDPKAPVRVERIPHALAYGVSAEGLGLRPAMSMSLGAVTPTMATSFEAVVREDMHEPAREFRDIRPMRAMRPAPEELRLEWLADEPPRRRIRTLPDLLAWLRDLIERVEGLRRGLEAGTSHGPGWLAHFFPTGGDRAIRHALEALRAAAGSPASPLLEGCVERAAADLESWLKDPEILEAQAGPRLASLERELGALERELQRSRCLKARVVPTPGGESLVLEVAVIGDPLAWQPGPWPIVFRAGEEPLVPAVLEAHTTRPGRVEPGSAVRLEIDARSKDLAAGAGILVRSGDAWIWLETGGQEGAS